MMPCPMEGPLIKYYYQFFLYYFEFSFRLFMFMIYFFLILTNSPIPGGSYKVTVFVAVPNCPHPPRNGGFGAPDGVGGVA